MANAKTHRLNETLRDQLVKHASELYFPQETIDLATRSLYAMFSAYLEDTFGPAPPYMTQGSAQLKMIYKVQDKDVSASFQAPWVRLPFVSSDANGDYMYIDIHACPIPGFRECAEGLLSFLRQKQDFHESLSGELLRFATTETFLRRFPSLSGAFAQIIEPETVDLPVVVEIDMESINQGGLL